MVALGMVTLAAEHWHETVAFYHKRLGLQLLEFDDDAQRARVGAGPGIVLEIHSGGWASEKRKTTRLNPVALCLRVDDLSRTVCKLEQHGVRFLDESAEGTTPVLDPDGNRVYLYATETVPRVPDGWELEGERRIP